MTNQRPKSDDSSDRPDSALEVLSEMPDEVFCKAEHFGERGYNWYDFSRAALVERYLTDEISICLKGRCWFSEVDSEDFCAFFRNYPGIWRRHPGNGGIDGAIDGDLIAYAGRSGYDQQQGVLISDVEVMNDRQDIVITGRVAVGLCANNAAEGAFADSLYTSSVTRLFEFFSVPVNGELMTCEQALPVLLSKGDNEMIETRPEMVNDLTGKDRQPQRRERVSERFKDVMSAIVVEISDDSIRGRVTGKEPIDLRVEVLDTFFGPLNLRSDTI